MFYNIVLSLSLSHALSFFLFQKRGGLKGQVDLNSVKVIEKVSDSAFDKPSFQVVHGDLTLYVIADDEAQRQDWLELLRQCEYIVSLLVHNCTCLLLDD